MSNKKIYFDFQDGVGFIDVSHLVKYDSLRITKRAFNDSYHFAQNELSLSIKYEEDLYAKLRYISKPIIVQVKEGIEFLFSGQIPPTKSREYNGILNNTIMSLEGIDDISLLEIPVGDVLFSDCAVMNPAMPSKSLVHLLANIAGMGSNIDNTITIPTIIDRYAPQSEDTTVLAELDTLLFEYGYVLNISGAGVLSPIRWIYEETETPSFIFNESNIIEKVSIQDTIQNYDGVELIYYELKKASRVLLYKDSNCAYSDEGGFTGYNILAGTTYPPETNAIDETTGEPAIVYMEYTDDSIKYWTNKAIKNNLDYNYKAFSSDFSAMVATENHFADYRVSNGIIPSIPPVYLNTKCRIVYKNPTTNNELKVFYNNVFGDVWYRSTERTSVINIVDTPTNVSKYATKYIYDKVNADILVKSIAAQHSTTRTTYSFSSSDKCPVGSLVSVIMGDGTNQLCFVKDRIWDESQLSYSYSLLSTSVDKGELTSQKTSVSVTVNNDMTYGYYNSIGTPEAINNSIAAGMYAVQTGTDDDIPVDVGSINAFAKQDYIDLQWEWDASSLKNTINRFVIDVSKDSGATWTSFYSTSTRCAYYFDRATDGFPETTDGTYSLDKWRFRVKAENIYGRDSLGYSPIASVNVQAYKTWIPPKPVIQVLTAIESGFEFAASYDDASFYGSGKRLEFYVEGVKKEERGGIILFNRFVDGYPETAASRAYHGITTGKALDNFAVRAKLITDENSGTLGDVKTPNVQYYKTWIPRLPSLALSVAGRKISLSIIPTNEVYGSIENRIQIRRYDEASYFALGNDDDAYTNETAYKQGAVNSYTSTFFNNYDQAVPLENQAAELPIDTSYYYRIQASQSGFSDPVYTTAWTAAKLAIAKATSIRDITANSIKQAQLANKAVTNRTIDDLAVDTDQLAIGAVVADRIAARTITAEQLSVVARSKINSFIHESDGLTGWTTGGEIVTVGSERALKLSSPNPYLLSDPFDVQPDELLEFSFGLQCSREASQGLYIGLTLGDTYERFSYSWTDKKWNLQWVSTNSYFVEDYRSSTKRFFKTYILGYNIDITTVPSPQYTDESYDVRCLKLSSGKTQTRIRAGYNAIITPTFWYLFSPQVYQVGAGKIVAQQIDVKNLSAMSSKLGEIQGDTADYKLVMGSGGSAEEGTFLLGAETDSAYLRRWKKNGVWKMAIKLATFIIDAVSSKIKGVFEVQKTDGTPVFKMDPTTGIQTINGGTVWHSGNDGPDSGLVADTVAWSGVSSKPNLWSGEFANGYWGLVTPAGTSSDYVRAPSSGILPYAPGGSGYLGSPHWPFNYIYGTNIYGNINGTAPTPATEANNTQIATTAFVKNQKYEPNRGTGAESIALGVGASARGHGASALGFGTSASGDYSLALGSGASILGLGASASGAYSIAIGPGAVAPRSYQITIGTKFVYLTLTSTETEATVYNALSPWVHPTTIYNQGAMGSFGTVAITRLHRATSNTIELVGNDNGFVKQIRSGNSDPIGKYFTICTVIR